MKRGAYARKNGGSMPVGEWDKAMNSTPRRPKDNNYDGINKAPARNMGEGDFANMPSETMIRKVPSSQDFRGGNMNNWQQGVDDLSGVDEQRPPSKAR